MAVNLRLLGGFVFISMLGFQIPTQALECGAEGLKNKLEDCGVFSSRSLSKVDMNKSSLKNFTFEFAEMRDLNFTEVDMSHAKIKGAKVSESRFHNTNFSHTTFVGVRFNNVDFSGSEFKEALFVRCFFRDVNFKDTNIQQNQLVDPIFVP